MRRSLCFALTVLVAACVPTKARIVGEPAAARNCTKGDPALAYVIDGKSATCTAAMSLPADRIASVEVLKGDAAVSLYGPAARAGVIVIKTKR